MTLLKGSAARTKAGFSTNVVREVAAGKPHKQAVAIAYAQARKQTPHPRKRGR
jgi:hypothetical protein